MPAPQRRRAAERAAAHLARACRRWGVRHVAVYLGMAEELDTRPLIRRLRAAGCALYAPRIGVRNTLHFARLAGTLVANRYGIDEPRGSRPDRLDLVVVPLVAFDADGNRLGMGGGYYDRLLPRSRPQRRPLRVGFAFAAQEVGVVPTEEHDVRLDAIATERGVRRFR